MTTKNLSSVATDVIAAYGITATNVINSCRFGGERFIGFVDQQVATALNRSTSALNKGIRSNLADGHKRFSGYTVKGLQLGTSRAQSVVGVAVDLATKGVSLVAAKAGRLDRAANFNALAKLNRVAMPAATVVSDLVDRIEAGSSTLVTRAAGKPMPAKAVATRKLNATTRKAAAQRKQITKAATKQVDEAVATSKRMTKTATRRVSQAIAETATETSNVARRVARKAKATAKAA